MTFKFLIRTKYISEKLDFSFLIFALRTALVQNLNEYESTSIEEMIEVSQIREGAIVVDENGIEKKLCLICLFLMLPNETEQPQAVIEDFITNLSDSQEVDHVLKFDDPILQNYLSLRAQEIFGLEMKLRNVLSMIYLHAYQGRVRWSRNDGQ